MPATAWSSPSITSTIGHTLTGLFETAFQVIPGVGGLPSELTYEKNGLMFGNRLIRDTSSVVFQDPNFRTDLINYIHNCTMYDLIDGTVDPGAFSGSDDVWTLMGTPNPARFTTLTGAGGAVTVDTCPTAYANLNGRLPAQITRIEGKLAFQPVSYTHLDVYKRQPRSRPCTSPSPSPERSRPSASVCCRKRSWWNGSPSSRHPPQRHPRSRPRPSSRGNPGRPDDSRGAPS